MTNRKTIQTSPPAVTSDVAAIDQGNTVIYRGDGIHLGEPVTLGALYMGCSDIYKALTGCLATVKELEKMDTDTGANLGLLLMLRLTLEYAINRLSDICPNADKDARRFSLCINRPDKDALYAD
jgi:hypothetical protein